VSVAGDDPGDEAPLDPRELDVVVLDLETTGLSPRCAEVVEAGAVHFAGGRPRATFHALVRPERPIPPGATAVHGIADAAVADRPAFRDVFPRLAEFVGDRPVVAHHARFDLGFLEAAARRAAVPAPGTDAWCTVRLSRRLFPELPRHDLDSLCATHGIRRAVAHRALEDACATAELFGILAERAAVTGLGPRALAALARPAGPAGPARPRSWTDEERDALEEAILTGDRLELAYVSRRGRRSARTVVPYAVGGPERDRRLVAYDVEVGRTRTFRLDRVVSLRRTT